MSASNKKKLRKEQNAAQLTERQLAEQKEAKKLKIYTAAFVAVLAVLLVVAVTVGVKQTIASSGIREKNTVAVTVGEHKISNAELNYFFVDTINSFYSTNGSYAAMFGLDVTKPLDEQYMDEANEQTWADYFMETAKSNARNIYAMNDAAVAAGHTLSEEDQATVVTMISNLNAYATLYGYQSGDEYVQAMYGKGASLKGYEAYLTASLMSDSYYTAYGESLTFTDEEMAAKDAENPNAFSSFTYNSYYLATSKFLEGGTTGDDGTTTYSDEEKAASVAACKEAAESLTAAEITSPEALDAAIAQLSFNADTSAASTLYENYLYSSINHDIAHWLTESGRKEGDIGVIESASTSTDADGKETTTVNGYYVVYFQGMTDNRTPMANVRHILAAFEGGTTGENGEVTYSDEEKAAAKAEAEALLNEWKSGEATEDSFAALANEKSDDGDGTTGGLYSDINPASNYVPNFLNWALDSHKAGDTGIVETEYGYHVMFYAGDSEMTYRDYQIDNVLRTAALSDWYNSVIEGYEIAEGNTKYIKTDLVLSSGN